MAHGLLTSSDGISGDDENVRIKHTIEPVGHGSPPKTHGTLKVRPVVVEIELG